MMAAPTTEATYVVEGDKVKLTLNGQTMIFAIDKDGCLNSDMGVLGAVRLCK